MAEFGCLPSAVVFSFLLLTSSSQLHQPQGDERCVKEMPPPEQPFRVVWNHPDPCERKGFPLNLSSYGIIHNRRRSFIGEEIQTLYKTGRWPRYSSGRAIDGGLPQLWNVTTFAKTRADLQRYRVSNFTGLAILDFESWRPNFITNFGNLKVYKIESINLVRRRHPEYSAATATEVAAQQWETAARRIISTKLSIGQELMPGGHWGYYGYPRSWAGNSSPGQNNRMSWLWRKATGLYPSIYLKNPNQSTASKIARVAKEMTEAVRIQQAFSPPNTPIYPYSNIQQGPSLFFQQDHLRVTLGVPADMGASGIVLWGSSSYYRAHGQCQRLQRHVRTVLGPFVKNLTQFMIDCSDTLCGGHGRCVHNSRDSLIPEAEAITLSARCSTPNSRFSNYHCRCYSSWSGPCCQTHTLSSCQQLAHGIDDQAENPHTTEPTSTENPKAGETQIVGNVVEEETGGTLIGRSLWELSGLCAKRHSFVCQTFRAMTNSSLSLQALDARCGVFCSSLLWSAFVGS